MGDKNGWKLHDSEGYIMLRIHEKKKKTLRTTRVERVDFMIGELHLDFVSEVPINT